MVVARPIAIAWPIAFARPIATVAIAAAAVAAPTAVLFALALRALPLHLAFAAGERVELRRFTSGGRRLMLFGLWLLLRLLLSLLRFCRL